MDVTSVATLARSARNSTRRPPLRRVAVAVAVASAAAVGGAGAGIASQATAQPATMRVKGTIKTVLGPAPGCTAPTGLCFPGEVRGSIRGTIKGQINSSIPTQQPGVSLVDASVTFHTRDGDLSFAHEQVLYNTTPGGAGEFSYLLEVTGGTGLYAGATGHLRGSGNAPPSTGISTAKYVGEIKLG